MLWNHSTITTRLHSHGGYVEFQLFFMYLWHSATMETLTAPANSLDNLSENQLWNLLRISAINVWVNWCCHGKLWPYSDPLSFQGHTCLLRSPYHDWPTCFQHACIHYFIRNIPMYNFYHAQPAWGSSNGFAWWWPRRSTCSTRQVIKAQSRQANQDDQKAVFGVNQIEFFFDLSVDLEANINKINNQHSDVAK